MLPCTTFFASLILYINSVLASTDFIQIINSETARVYYQSSVQGGVPNAPTVLSLTTSNEISRDASTNYFKYTSQQGEKLILHAFLNTPMSDQQKSRCSAGGSYPTQIRVYDNNFDLVRVTCGEDLTFEFPQSNKYTIQFYYPDNGPGYGYAASIIGNSVVSAPSGPDGTPSNPKLISMESNNQLSINTFYNYYLYTANKGDKIIINVALDKPLSLQQKSRCSSNSGTGSIPSSYDTQIHVRDLYLNRVSGNCGDELSYTFDESGPRIFHFAYGSQSSGHFVATVVPVDPNGDGIGDPAFSLDTSGASPLYGLFYNSNESGWGVNLIQQYSKIFATMFTYNKSGSPTWYVASNCVVEDNGCSGEIYGVTAGSEITSTWNGANLSVSPVGNVSFSFTDRDNGTMTFKINGVSGSKVIKRQIWATH